MKYTRLFVFVLLLIAALPVSSARAQVIIRDAEIEEYMKGWFEPIFSAAGMNSDQVNVIIVQDSAINAFVAGGSNIFLYTGLIQKTDNPGELIGVVAHELGHVAGGHLIRGREAMENASYESILGTILGVGAAVLSGESGAAAAIGSAGNTLAMRKYLSTSRTFESSADQAALRYLNTAQINPSGFKSFMEKLEDEELAPTSRQSEYVQTHPMTRNRIMAIEEGVTNSMASQKPLPAAWIDQHARMKAKITSFISPQQVAWNYDDRDRGIPAQYARAIASYRENQVNEALRKIDDLLAAEPKNPWFMELKGQMLVDFARIKEAIPYYEKALAIRPDAALIRIDLAHAQIESAGEDSRLLQKAIDNLQRAQKAEPRSTYVHRLMATAYGRMGKEPAARLHLAEEALLQGKRDYAKGHAEYAVANLPKGAPDRLRALDILSFIQQNPEKEKKS